MGDRWAVYIDIEGFGVLYDRETTVLEALGDLMEGIYAIGTRVYPESPDRLFAHQTGDGFIVVGEFGSPSLEVPTSIATALLRHVSARGRFAKASLGEGELADIWGCYPRRIREVRRSGDTVRLGGGLMTVFPVMGTALIDAVSVAKRSPSGSLLTLASAKRSRLPAGCVVHEVEGGDVISIDWVHSSLPLVEHLQNQAELRRPGPEEIAAALRRYTEQQQPPARWTSNTRALLGLPVEG